MDGNGRWAQQRGLPRLEGHRASRESIRETVRGCTELGVGFLTLYTFSVENWSRPETEVRALMVLIEYALREDSTDMHAMNTRVRLLGDRGPLPQPLKDEIDRVEELTGENTGLTLQLAINYGGRQEILQAAFALARDAAAGRVSAEELDESHFTRHLYRPDAPDPDLLIRTGGDFRVSNYLLWEIAYTEIYVTPVMWPDFRLAHLYEAVVDYQGRERRFGGVKNVA
ncbi:MAG: polyprenyl diphosphate synthase [Armatimonadetes bacterium]|nr:polyprenyl diphosphate synthase [Armatimonadota bacterium]